MSGLPCEPDNSRGAFRHLCAPVTPDGVHSGDASIRHSTVFRAEGTSNEPCIRLPECPVVRAKNGPDVVGIRRQVPAPATWRG